MNSILHDKYPGMCLKSLLFLIHDPVLLRTKIGSEHYALKRDRETRVCFGFKLLAVIHRNLAFWVWGNVEVLSKPVASQP